MTSSRSLNQRRGRPNRDQRPAGPCRRWVFCWPSPRRSPTPSPTSPSMTAAPRVPARRTRAPLRPAAFTFGIWIRRSETCQWWWRRCGTQPSRSSSGWWRGSTRKRAASRAWPGARVSSGLLPLCFSELELEGWNLLRLISVTSLKSRSCTCSTTKTTSTRTSHRYVEKTTCTSTSSRNWLSSGARRQQRPTPVRIFFKTIF